MTDAAGFRLELQRFATETLPTIAADLQRRVVAEALTLIVQSTPVGNSTKWEHNVIRAQRGLPPLPKGYVGGHARKNWQVGIGTRSTAIKPGVDNAGNQTINDGYREVAKIKAPTVAFITNLLPYMQRLEEGHSKQAPTGMVANAVAAINAKYARVQQ